MTESKLREAAQLMAEHEIQFSAVGPDGCFYLTAAQVVEWISEGKDHVLAKLYGVSLDHNRLWLDWLEAGRCPVLNKSGTQCKRWFTSWERHEILPDKFDPHNLPICRYHQEHGFSRRIDWFCRCEDCQGTGTVTVRHGSTETTIACLSCTGKGEIYREPERG